MFYNLLKLTKIQKSEEQVEIEADEAASMKTESREESSEKEIKKSNESEMPGQELDDKDENDSENVRDLEFRSLTENLKKQIEENVKYKQ